MNEKRADVGVIIGRFQLHELHLAHKDLIDSVVQNHPKVIIFLGLSPLIGTIKNPLDFEARKQMLQEMYPEVTILYIKNHRDDIVWSKRLDSMIGDIVSPIQSVALYGSRESFISCYHGKYKTIELESTTIISGTEIRNSISKKVKNSALFRAGVIWGTYNRYPTVYSTSDVAIISESGTQILLGKKPDEDKYRFIGGFASTKAKSHEEDAKREVLEETGAEIGPLTYIGSFNIDDWRYRGEVDCVRTMFFMAKYLFGPLQANDDITSIKWFNIDKLTENDIMPEHSILLDALKKFMSK